MADDQNILSLLDHKRRLLGRKNEICAALSSIDAALQVLRVHTDFAAVQGSVDHLKNTREELEQLLPWRPRS